MYEIIQITTVHHRHDTRVRYKHSSSLAEFYPNKVALFVQDGLEDEIDQSSLFVHSVGPMVKSRLRRFFIGSIKMYRAIKSHKPKIVHFHDPELIPLALVLKLHGILIIYDIHEDVPKQVLAKQYIKPMWIRYVLAKFIQITEYIAVRLFDLSMPAVESIAQRFPSKKTCVIRNVPKISSTVPNASVERDDNKFVINYAGALTHARGIGDLVNSMDLLPDNFELHLLGPWHPEEFFDECRQMKGWQKCVYYGRVPHPEVSKYIQRANLGVQMVHDIPNYRGGLATKVFEYLVSGIPTLMSDTEERRRVYRDLCEYAQPSDPEQIANEIFKIQKNYEKYVESVKSKKKFIIDNYSWESESAKLRKMYDELLEKQ